MTKSHYEYRINKKNAECFRTERFEEARKKFSELSAKRPGLYTMQYRSVPLDKRGIMLSDGLGKPLWGSWLALKV